MHFLIQWPKKDVQGQDTGHSHFTNEKAKSKEMLVKLPVSHNNYMTQSGFKLSLKMHVLTLWLSLSRTLSMAFLSNSFCTDEPTDQSDAWPPLESESRLLLPTPLLYWQINPFHTWLVQTMSGNLIFMPPNSRPVTVKFPKHGPPFNSCNITKSLTRVLSYTC